MNHVIQLLLVEQYKVKLGDNASGGFVLVD